MNKTDLTIFFLLLNDAEEEFNAGVDMPDSEWIEGYDYVMEVVRLQTRPGNKPASQTLPYLIALIEQIDSYVDDFEGHYGRGYQDATNILLGVVSKLVNGLV